MIRAGRILPGRAARRAGAIIALAVALGGCSDGEPEAADDDDHVWKEQTRSLDKARDVSKTLEDAAARQRQSSQ